MLCYRLQRSFLYQYRSLYHIPANIEYPNDECVDNGFSSMTCAEVDAYFLENQSLETESWCGDPEWGLNNCCNYCRKAGEYLFLLVWQHSATRVKLNIKSSQVKTFI